MWRGDLSPFGCEAVAKISHALTVSGIAVFAAAARPNGDKSPRHMARVHMGSVVRAIEPHP
nr:hypothetical protein FEE99_04315 [Pseudomonas sp. ef1]